METVADMEGNISADVRRKRLKQKDQRLRGRADFPQTSRTGQIKKVQRTVQVSAAVVSVVNQLAHHGRW
jgi:hypothetical protein